MQNDKIVFDELYQVADISVQCQNQLCRTSNVLIQFILTQWRIELLNSLDRIVTKYYKGEYANDNNQDS